MVRRQRRFLVDCGYVMWHNQVVNCIKRWERRFPNSALNFDLCLTNPEALDFGLTRELLRGILAGRHRGLTLSSRAVQEFQRWFDLPDTPLKSDAYVLLSNWFLTQSGDRQSMVANLCEKLWDVLFPCRPVSRLSSPEPGRNHVMIPAEFERFWRRMVDAQGGSAPGAAGAAPVSNAEAKIRLGDPATCDGSTADRLRAAFEKEGLHFEVEGPPRALSDFLQMVSNWKTKPEGVL
jgi:hypothetical protein